ncbi:RNA-guided endonuclease IscB [Nocardiopsis sp. CNR-923]|uniref:RNA-guided endonuclease IscB n=1 Tax=Nocardiopsis sp. CNR-923 TaxID=1904965 RepID=UPI000A51DE29|nr:RNA-guided endonuclease IscB [Nocardiopsis sp. CNR-923]
MVPGAEHGRGETGTASPGGSGVTPEPCGAAEKGREAHTTHPYVFVLDKHGTPLQPCPPARARILLAKGRAAVHRHTPFTIRLKDRTAADSQIDGVEIGVDPGSKNTGIAVFTEEAGQRRGRYSIQLDHRGATIRKKMGQRSAYRRRRRSANLRHRPPRFNNRTRPKGWLAPSLRHRPDTTMGWVHRLTRLAPVRVAHEVEPDPQPAAQVPHPGRGGGRQGRGDHRDRGHGPGRGVHGPWIVCPYPHRPARVPRLRLPRTTRFFGFATGDLVRAAVPTGKKAGTHTGRVAVRASGSFNVTTARGTVQGVNHRHVRLLQRADGYAYTTRKEKGVSSRP